jgi:hypothetical protein
MLGQDRLKLQTLRPRWERGPEQQAGRIGDVGRQTRLSAGTNRRQLGSRPFNLNRVIFEVIATAPQTPRPLSRRSRSVGKILDGGAD